MLLMFRIDIAQYQHIIQDLRNQVQLLRDQRDELEVRLTTTNEARFSRLSGMSKFHIQFNPKFFSFNR